MSLRLSGGLLVNAMMDGYRSEYREILGADICISANGETSIGGGIPKT